MGSWRRAIDACKSCKPTGDIVLPRQALGSSTLVTSEEAVFDGGVNASRVHLRNQSFGGNRQQGARWRAMLLNRRS